MKGLIAVLAVLCAAGVAFFVYSSPTTAPPAEMTEAEIAQIEAEVGALDDAIASAVVVWDLDTFLGFFSEDLSWAVAGEVHHSLNSWADLVSANFSTAEGPLENCESLNLRRQVLTPGVVISTAVVNCLAPTPDGPVLVIDHTWTAVWARKGGQWKIVNLSETYAPGMAEG